MLRHPRLHAVARLLGRLPRAVLVALALGLLVGALAIPSLLEDRSAKVSGLAPEVGSADFSFAANGVSAPTGRKPEASKLWFADGSWWGSLFRPARDAYVINRFDAESGSWIDTGVVIDDRNASRADVLWAGDHLYVVSGGTDPRSPKHAALFMRFSYDSGARRYSLDQGFPVRLTDGGAETFVLDRDESGRIWVTFTNGRKVFVTHSLQSDRDWLPPFALPLAEAQNLTEDDISAVVAYDGAVGIMWSDQTDGAMYFARRPVAGPDDQPWSVTAAVQGPALADDHMNLKALHDDPAGLVVATVKTSRNDQPGASGTDPLILLLVLERDGTWQNHVVGTVRDDATRPLLLVDTDHRELYVFTSGPCCSGGTLYVKQSSLDAIEFPSGPGTPFIRRGNPGALNNPTSTKQNLGTDSGLLIMASDDKIDWYMHNYLRLDGPAVPRPSLAAEDPLGASPGPGEPAASPGVVTTWLADGFETDGLARWQTLAGPGSVVAVQDGIARTDRRAVHLAVGSDPEGLAAARFSLPEPQAFLDADLDFRMRAEGPEGGNVPLLRFFDAQGKRLLALYRQNHKDGRIWVWVGGDHAPTSARVDMDTWAHLDVQIRPSAGGTTVQVRIDGRLAAEVPVDLASPIAVVQIGNDSKGQPFDLVVDNVKVYR